MLHLKPNRILNDTCVYTSIHIIILYIAGKQENNTHCHLQKRTLSYIVKWILLLEETCL